MVDAEKQGDYQGHETVPDGVYTDNVVWTEILSQPILPKIKLNTQKLVLNLDQLLFF